jgi:hypothetical protein
MLPATLATRLRCVGRCIGARRLAAGSRRWRAGRGDAVRLGQEVSARGTKLGVALGIFRKRRFRLIHDPESCTDIRAFAANSNGTRGLYLRSHQIVLTWDAGRCAHAPLCIAR